MNPPAMVACTVGTLGSRGLPLRYARDLRPLAAIPLDANFLPRSIGRFEEPPAALLWTGRGSLQIATSLHKSPPLYSLVVPRLALRLREFHPVLLRPPESEIDLPLQGDRNEMCFSGSREWEHVTRSPSTWMWEK